MMTRGILIAGVGNIFLGDDAFGVLVAQRLANRALPSEVRVVDFGIRGLDLAYALLEEYDAVILVDALPRGGPPGTLYVLEPSAVSDADTGDESAMIDTHGVDPVKVLRLVAALGGRVNHLYVVGCEPEPLADLDEMQTEISPGVQAAIEEATPLVERIVGQILRGESVGPGDTVAFPKEDQPCPL
jgi:hydrogenase maturation protease